MEYKKAIEQIELFRHQKEYEMALALAQSTLEKIDQDHLEAKADILATRAKVHADQGLLNEALHAYKQIESIYIKLDKRPQQMEALFHIGRLFFQMGQIECAEKCLIQVVESYNQLDIDPLHKAHAFKYFALTHEERKSQSQAEIYWTKAKEEYKKAKSHEGVLSCDLHLT